jgi:multicomponent Na+:H+ antiporter subunit G
MITDSIVATLLIAGVLVEFLCCGGLLAMKNPYDRLHAIAPGNILPPILFTAAIVIREGFSQAGIKAILIALVLILVSPIVSHATARAAWLRENRSAKEGE